MTQAVGSQIVHDPKFILWWKANHHRYAEALKEQLAEAFAGGMAEKAEFRRVIRHRVEEAMKEAAWDVAYKVTDGLEDPFSDS